MPSPSFTLSQSPSFTHAPTQVPSPQQFISSPYVIAVRNDEFIYTIEERRCVTYDTNMQVIEDCTNIWNNTLVPYGNVVFRCDVIFYNIASSTIDSVDLKNKQWRNLINLNL